jgi:hypothetical protein
MSNSMMQEIVTKMTEAQKYTVFVVGDSITAGFNATDSEHTYTACFARGLAAHFPERRVSRYDGIWYPTKDHALRPLKSYEGPITVQEGTRQLTVVRSGIGGNTVRRMLDRKEDFIGKDAVLLQGVKALGNTQIEDLITNIAALFSEVGTPLKPLFAKMIDQKSVNLPRVDDIYYHEGKGYSCLIHSKMFLVGNAAMMEYFNIDFPEEIKNIKLKNGRYPVFVAYQKSPAGIFITSYEHKADTEAAICFAAEEQVDVGIVSNDFLFCEDLLKSLYPETHPEYFHFISSALGEECREHLQQKEKSPDLIASISGVKGLLACLLGSGKLLASLRINRIIRVLYTVLSLLLIFFIALSSYSANTALQILAFQLIWMLPVCAICTFCK